MKKNLLFFCIVALTSVAFTGCKKNNKDDPKVNEPLDPGAGDQEVITRISLQVIDSATSAFFTVVYSDPKGNGNFTVDSLTMKASHTYLATLSILDDTKNPIDTVSNEIKEEANYHRFHYSLVSANGSAASLTTVLTDLDTRTPSQPLGLSLKIRTGPGKGQANFIIHLRHFENGQEKTADIMGGVQDLYVTFPTIIQ